MPSRKRPDLYIEYILKWADDYLRRTGKWPNVNSGRIRFSDDTWRNIDEALARGYRGLPRKSGWTLARLLNVHRGVRNSEYPPALDEVQIFSWAEAHYRRTGRWPAERAGRIEGAPEETWLAVDMALRKGRRGLPGGSSLARLLADRGAKRNLSRTPPLSKTRILKWADAHHGRTGEWPQRESGPITGVPGETWAAVNSALQMGRRGLPSGTSLAKLLLEERGIVHNLAQSRLSKTTILHWADAHRERTGRWPSRSSGDVVDKPEETWSRIDSALQRGHRGLPGGSSLAKLLAKKRNVRNQASVLDLTIEEILCWADRYHRRHGRWPTAQSGAVAGRRGETWSAVDAALRKGRRGLRGGLSLARLLDERRGVPNIQRLPRLSRAKILRWCDAFRRRNGQWPQRNSGAIDEAPREDWANIDTALRIGLRGLPGGSSLARLLAAKRGKRNRRALPRLTKKQIRVWAMVHKQRTGRNPSGRAGSIPEAPGETWSAVDQALRKGLRGLPGGSSLVRLLAAELRDTTKRRG